MSTAAEVEETYYLRDEAAKILRMHPRTLTRLAKQGDIKASRSGNKNVYGARAIAAYLERRPVATGELTPKPSRNPKRSK